MYDSHGVYLRVLRTIYMYKFNRCHVVVFHGFFVPFTDFRQKLAGFRHKPPGNRRASFLKNWSIYRPNRLIYRCSWFYCSSVVSGAFRLNFSDFRRFLPNFQKPTRSVTSGFCGSAAFSNTAPRARMWKASGFSMDLKCSNQIPVNFLCGKRDLKHYTLICEKPATVFWKPSACWR
jgi:hypothetical protein